MYKYELIRNIVLIFFDIGQISVPVVQETTSAHIELPGFNEIRFERRSGLFEIWSTSFCVGDFISTCI